MSQPNSDSKFAHWIVYNYIYHQSCTFDSVNHTSLLVIMYHDALGYFCLAQFKLFGFWHNLQNYVTGEFPCKFLYMSESG